MNPQAQATVTDYAPKQVRRPCLVPCRRSNENNSQNPTRPSQEQKDPVTVVDKKVEKTVEVLAAVPVPVMKKKSLKRALAFGC
ncbi:hypothetical protein JCGZ_09119 [Jatropha curcas]|uniref:Uncharacterized protein n=1 Tax=Jatropha curcas TaxID=180498 RepID=A0A067KHH6_JATCU|nr:hypothetical protein JCGZ_09119 [Jatropha curcas]